MTVESIVDVGCQKVKNCFCLKVFRFLSNVFAVGLLEEYVRVRLLLKLLSL